MATHDGAEFSYLRLNQAQRIYLVEYATGRDVREICAELPNEQTPETPGIRPETVQRWRERSRMFANAEKEIERDPLWATRNIVVPMAISRLGKQDLDYLFSRNKQVYKGMNGKRVEILMQMGGMIGDKQSAAPGSLASILVNMQLVLPELNPQEPRSAPAQLATPQYAVIDVTPEPPAQRSERNAPRSTTIRDDF